MIFLSEFKRYRPSSRACWSRRVSGGALAVLAIVLLAHPATCAAADAPTIAETVYVGKGNKQLRLSIRGSTGRLQDGKCSEDLKVVKMPFGLMRLETRDAASTCAIHGSDAEPLLFSEFAGAGLLLVATRSRRYYSREDYRLDRVGPKAVAVKVQLAAVFDAIRASPDGWVARCHSNFSYGYQDSGHPMPLEKWDLRFDEEHRLWWGRNDFALRSASANGIKWAGKRGIFSLFPRDDHVELLYTHGPQRCVGRLIRPQAGGGKALPPLLKASFSLNDARTGASGALETGEVADLEVRIQNDGPALSESLAVQIDLATEVTGVTHGPLTCQIPFVLPGQTTTWNVRVTVGAHVVDGALKLKLSGSDAVGYKIPTRELTLKISNRGAPALAVAAQSRVAAILAGRTPKLNNGSEALLWIPVTNRGPGPAWNVRVHIEPATKGVRVLPLQDVTGIGAAGILPASVKSVGPSPEALRPIVRSANAALNRCVVDARFAGTWSGTSACGRSTIVLKPDGSAQFMLAVPSLRGCLSTMTFTGGWGVSGDVLSVSTGGSYMQPLSRVTAMREYPGSARMKVDTQGKLVPGAREVSLMRTLLTGMTRKGPRPRQAPQVKLQINPKKKSRAKSFSIVPAKSWVAQCMRDRVSDWFGGSTQQAAIDGKTLLSAQWNMAASRTTTLRRSRTPTGETTEIPGELASGATVEIPVAVALDAWAKSADVGLMVRVSETRSREGFAAPTQARVAVPTELVSVIARLSFVIHDGTTKTSRGNRNRRVDKSEVIEIGVKIEGLHGKQLARSRLTATSADEAIRVVQATTALGRTRAGRPGTARQFISLLVSAPPKQSGGLQLLLVVPGFRPVKVPVPIGVDGAVKPVEVTLTPGE